MKLGTKLLVTITLFSAACTAVLEPIDEASPFTCDTCEAQPIECRIDDDCAADEACNASTCIRVAEPCEPGERCEPGIAPQAFEPDGLPSRRVIDVRVAEEHGLARR